MSNKVELKPDHELISLAYTEGYEWFRNKWVGDHYEMCADLVRCFVPRPQPPIPDDVVEAACRAWCIADDLAPDPDATSYTRSGPRKAWEVRIPMMQAALTTSGLLDQVKALREALEPFALVSAEGVIAPNSKGHVTVTICAEYFHLARQTLNSQQGGG